MNANMNDNEHIVETLMEDLSEEALAELSNGKGDEE